MGEKKKWACRQKRWRLEARCGFGSKCDRCEGSCREKAWYSPTSWGKHIMQDVHPGVYEGRETFHEELSCAVQPFDREYCEFYAAHHSENADLAQNKTYDSMLEDRKMYDSESLLAGHTIAQRFEHEKEVDQKRKDICGFLDTALQSPALFKQVLYTIPILILFMTIVV